jgi:hypothetical protein
MRVQGTGKVNLSAAMRVSEKKQRTEAIMDIIWLSLSGHTVREELLGRHTRAWWLCAEAILANQQPSCGSLIRPTKDAYPCRLMLISSLRIPSCMSFPGCQIGDV